MPALKKETLYNAFGIKLRSVYEKEEEGAITDYEGS